MAGSVVMAFEEVCPDRIDLIHKNYRKLCNLLVDVEEWGQVVIISMLTRYARTQFTSPWKEVRHSSPEEVYTYLCIYLLSGNSHQQMHYIQLFEETTKMEDRLGISKSI